MQIYGSREPQAIAIRDLIHSSANASASAGASILLLERWIEKHEEKLKEIDISCDKLRDYATWLRAANNRHKEVIDILIGEFETQIPY